MDMMFDNSNIVRNATFVLVLFSQKLLINERIVRRGQVVVRAFYD